jgi:hypothetical protein
MLTTSIDRAYIPFTAPPSARYSTKETALNSRSGSHPARAGTALLLAAVIVAAAIGLASSSPARAGTNTLTTFHLGGNANDGIFFDVAATGGEDLVIDQIDVTISTFVSSTGDVEIWTRAGTHVGFEGSNVGWTLVGSYTGVVPAGNGTATVLGPLSTTITVPAGQVQAIFIVTLPDDALEINYSDGTAVGTLAASDSFLSIYEGTGAFGTFGGGTITTRVPPVTIHYTPESLLATPPTWTLQAKIAGGNTLNPNLPDYTPGTWSTKWVTVYLDCVPGDSPIDIERKDSSRTFYDGIHMWEHDPDDECVDEDGDVAALLAPYGPIMVDTKAPNCRVTPGTLYIPRNTTATVNFALDLTEIGPSGFLFAVASPTESGGAILNSASFLGGVPATGLQVDATMPNSTAAKIVFNILVGDVAGNTKTCTATVKAK